MPINIIKNIVEPAVIPKTSINGIEIIKKKYPNNSLFKFEVRLRHLLHGTFKKLFMLIAKHPCHCFDFAKRQPS